MQSVVTYSDMQDDAGLKAMIAGYMDKGFLENIIDMFKHDRSLFPLIAGLMTDERVRVRLGISALVETLARERSEGLAASITGIGELISNPNPTIRGDAAYLLGIIGNKETVPFLEAALIDENPDVREIAKEAIEDIMGREITCGSEKHFIHEESVG